MAPSDSPSEQFVASNAASRAERVVLLVESPEAVRSSDSILKLTTLLSVLWSGRWRILGVSAVFCVVAVAYALMATQWYRAEVVVMPVEADLSSTIGAQFGGLASLAGISVGSTTSTEPVAIWKSTEFMGSFIRELGIESSLIGGGGGGLHAWFSADNDADAPDVRDAVLYFSQNVVQISEDKRTGLITVSMEWTDPVVAAGWATEYVERLNERMRERALSESAVNIEYLREQLTNSSLVEMRPAIGRLLENELQREMLARGRDEYAVRVVDAADVPKYRYRPNRRLVVVIAAFMGLASAACWLLFGHVKNVRALGKS